jgi:uncharacterized membrane protein YhfC
VKPLRAILLALLMSLLLGFAIGLALRARFERPARYIGMRCLGTGAGSGAAPLPLHVGHAGPAVLDAGHHEEQVG